MSGFAQKNIQHQQLVWYGYHNLWTINEKWQLRNEVQERHFVNPLVQHQLVFRSNAERKLNNGWGISSEMVFFWQSPQSPYSQSRLVVPELRPVIGFRNRQPLSYMTITHRYKAEARFFHEVENNQLAGGFQFSNFRLRYQLGFEFPLLKKEKNGLTFKIKDEIMFNIGEKITKNTFDQNRISVAFNYAVNPYFSIETSYINWFQEQTSGVDFYNRNIVQFSLYHNIFLKKR